MKGFLILALAISLLAPQIARACSGSVTFTGAISTDWNTAGNWNPARVPVQTDDVCIPDPKKVTNAPSTGLGSGFVNSLTIDGNGQLIIDSSALNLVSTLAPSIINNLTLTSTQQTLSILTVAGSATFTGNLVLSPGQVSGRGTATISGAATVSNGNSYIVTSTVDNKGSITINQDLTGLTLGSGQGTFTNEANAAINLQGDQIIVRGGATFNNFGGIVKTAGTLTSYWNQESGVFTHQGANANITAQSGTLSFTLLSGTSTGAFSANSGATLLFAGGRLTLNPGTIFGGSGNLDIAGGVWDVEGLVSVDTSQLTFDGGGPAAVITGASELTIDSPTVTWNSGVLASSAGTQKVILSKGTTMTIRTGGYHGLQTTLDLLGTINLNAVSPNGDFALSSGNLTIEAGATFNIQADNSIHGQGTITDLGIFEKTGGTGVSTVDFTGSFNTTNISTAGTVTVKTGTLNFATLLGGTWAGTNTVDSGATLEFSAGIYTFEQGTAITGSGTTLLTVATWTINGDVIHGTDIDTSAFEFDGVVGSGIIQGPGNLTLNSPNSTWTGGAMQVAQGAGITTIPKKTALTIKNGQTTQPLVNGRTINNLGTVTITDTTKLALGGGMIWNNKGVFTFASDGGIVDNGGGATFNNNGTVQKTGGNANFITFNGIFNNNAKAKVIAVVGILSLNTSLGMSAGRSLHRAPTGSCTSRDLAPGRSMPVRP